MKAFWIPIILIFSFLNISSELHSQSINGRILNDETSDGISQQEVLINGEVFLTDLSGKFSIPNSFKESLLILRVEKEGFDSIELEFANTKSTIELGILFLSEKVANIRKKEQDQFLFDRDFLVNYDFNDEVSGLLTAAWDPFGSVAGYNFGATRFSARGMQLNHSMIYLNNVPFNNLDNGRYFWSLWGGLNDAFRSSYSQHGLNTTDFCVSGLAGTENIDIKASNQRAGTRLSLDHTNRTYTNRIMLSHNSGVQANGWSYAFTASKRWGNSGYVEGTYYDGYAYFASVEKELSNRHSLNLTAFGSPTTRGRASASTQDLYDLLDNNYYNPNWGFQNGKVRNSREYRTHQPVFILGHDFNVNDNTSISTSVAFQTGKFGSTRLGWLEAADPRPDYYGNLPYDNRETLSESDLQLLIDRYSDPSVSQLDWNELYEINRERQYTIKDISGDPLKTREENISAYIVEEQRYDNNKLALSTNIVHQFSTRSALKSGAVFQYDRNHNFKVVDDLLGGSYYLDVDGFSLRETADPRFRENEVAFIQNDLARPNRLLSEGDRYGYDYYKHIQNINAWSTFEYSLPKIDLKFSGVINNTRFWREGLVENGKFPGSGPGLKSLGRSNTASFIHGTAKVGATYKINGRNYIYSNLAYITRAPLSRNSFESADTRNSLVQNLSNEKHLGGELGYIVRHPKLNARVTGFYYRSRDEIKSDKFYLVNIENSIAAFGNLITSNRDMVNYGLEIGIDYKLTSTVSLKYAGAIGEYYFDSNPDALFTIDNSGAQPDYNRLGKAYLKGFNVGGIPQIANSLVIRYENPNYWFATLTASYFDEIYIDTNPLRRTEEVSQAVLNVTESRGYEGPTKEELLTNIVSQEKYDSFFKFDFFARKSFRWNKDRDYRLAVYLSVENILNTTTNKIGGFEQLRFDYVGLDADRWGARYFYAWGTIYRIGATLSI